MKRFSVLCRGSDGNKYVIHFPVETFEDCDYLIAVLGLQVDNPDTDIGEIIEEGEFGTDIHLGIRRH